MKILVYDQDGKNLDKCISFLKINDFHCLAAESYKEAIRYLHADSSISLIICCVPLSDSKGMEFVKYIRNNLRFRHIPIMGMASDCSMENLVACRKLGVRDFVLKPVKPEFLIDRIQKVLDKSSGTVLLVAQDEVVLNILTKTIERENYKTYQASSITEAMSTINGEHIDLVITDLNMQPISGLDVLVEVKEHHPSLPVVLITGYASINREHAIQAGADNAIEKPFHNIQIKRILKSLISPIGN